MLHAGGSALDAGKAARLLARLQPVEIGERTSREVQIVSGIEAGAEVVLHPSDRIRDGIEVALR